MRARGPRGAARIAALALAVAACLEEPSPVGAHLSGATVIANPHNVLSAVVLVRAAGDSAAVHFRMVGAAGDSVTAAVPLERDSALVPVLGLLPATSYVLRVVVFGGGDSVVGDSMAFATDTLPSDLPSYAASGSAPLPGYVVFAAGNYGLVIDNTGRVVWYRRFPPNGPRLNFMAEPNGRYVALPPTPDPADVELWVEVDPLGNVTRSFGCALGLGPRFHDLIVELDGSYWTMCDETRTMDLSAYGGSPTAVVTGSVVQHISAAGALLFHWSPFDHFAISDLDSLGLIGSSVNWTHGNSLDVDSDGNLLVSFRSLSEVTKINAGTGEVMWRMGGRRNQFTFLDTPAPFFRQHNVRVAGPGRFIVLDNLGDAAGSRAERYAYDAGVRAVRLEQSYGSTPSVVTTIGGSVQDLGGGRALVSFGTQGRVEEFDAAGHTLWRIDGNPGYVFRAQRIRSLYRPGVGTSR